MKLDGKVAVITGAAGGIGEAMARLFCAEGARLVLSDLPGEGLDRVATDLKCLAIPCDVSKETELQDLIAKAEQAYGDIDVFCSNAGIHRKGGEEVPNDEWQLNWDIHVMAHVYAARVLAPKMAQRGDGYLVNTASAAGLLSHVNSATYAVTKHAAVAFAEWISITYGNRGVKVSVLCPQAVRTAMTAGFEEGVASVDGMMEPDVLASCVVETMEREEFLILPHPEVLDYMRRKTSDYDRWLSGMRMLKEKFSV